MKCQRCLKGEAAYRVHSDAIDMKVCAACAEEIQRLGIAVEVLIGDLSGSSRQIAAHKALEALREW
jgi:protein-arginine kinase activator protein McsA